MMKLQKVRQTDTTEKHRQTDMQYGTQADTHHETQTDRHAISQTDSQTLRGEVREMIDKGR